VKDGRATPQWTVGLVAILLLASIATGAAASDTPTFAVPLIWHVESEDGKVIGSRDPDRPVNPASVVKLAATLRALDTLGADHRFHTTIGATTEAGVPESLVVDGGADPDFHFENAVLLSHALTETGVTRVNGDLYVGETFWMGWERGTVGRETNAVRRRLEMGRRLREAWSPSSWNAEQRRGWAELAARRHWDASHPPSVTIAGRTRTDPAPKWRPLVVHRSEPLVVALRRFNVFSNNDIERLDASVGAASELSAFLERRLGNEAAMTHFATSSGLNGNRMTPRLVVRMLHDLRSWLAAHGRAPADVMPILGCGHSTLRELFPRLRDSRQADGLVGKTGTLNLQDGGVSALAGFLPVGPGLVFFVAAPGAGRALGAARAAEEDFVRRVLLEQGKVGPLVCPSPVPTSEALAEVKVTNKPTAR